jgi:hypothetical protein
VPATPNINPQTMLIVGPCDEIVITTVWRREKGTNG